MFYGLFGVAVLIFYWTLSQPERAFTRGLRRSVLWLVVSGYMLFILLAATGTQPFYSLLFIVYPLLYGVLLRRPVRALLLRFVRTFAGRFVLLFILLWFSELFAALDIADRDPIGRHMIVYIGFYVGLAAVLTFFLWRWRFGFIGLFTTGGLWGLLVERQFAGVNMLLSGDIFGFLTFASVILPVYGFYVAGPWLMFYEELQAHRRPQNRVYFLLFLALAIIPLITWFIATLILNALGFDTTVLVV